MIAPPSGDLEAFVRLFEASEWQQLDLVVGDVRLHLSKSDVPAMRTPLTTGPTTGSRGARAPKGQTARAQPSSRRGASISQKVEISAPHLGTFRRSAASGASALVNLGDRVTADTAVCTLEVLDARMTQRAGVDGIIREVCAEDGALVEAGEVLFIIEPQR